MKKYVLFFFLLNVISVKAQENTGSLTLFKLQPFSLITNNLEVGIERFNAKQSRSLEVNIGVRYAYKEENGPVGSTFSNENFYSKWIGLNATITRKLYAPAFKARTKNPQNSTGVYFAPFLRGDYTKNELNDILFVGYFDPNTSSSKSNYVRRNGSVNYLSITPGINIGFQFTLWQNLYIDTFLGGGLRMLNKNDQVKTVAEPQGQYIGDSNRIKHNTIESFQNRQGILPNVGISVGVKW